MIKLQHFKLEEFNCPCCGANHMQEEFLKHLDNIRDICGIPFIITSGYRCPKHNKEVGGKPDSAHTKGLAADIKCSMSWNRALIISTIIDYVVKHKLPLRIGIAKNFIHFDLDKNKPYPVIWVY